MGIIQVLAIGSILSLPDVLGAGPVPRFDLRTAFEHAETVVIGEVKSVTAVGPKAVAVGQQQVDGKEKRAAVRVLEQLKGPATPSEITVVYGLPDVPSDVADIAPGPRLLFLKMVGARYEVADPYYPSLPARLAADGQPATALDRAAIAMASVVRDPDANPAEKVAALSALEGGLYPRVLDLIRPATTDANNAVRIGAFVDLLEIGDASALQQASSLLLEPHGTIPSYLLHNITYAISVGRFASDSIGTLALLLKAPETETRRAAAQGLWHISDHEVVKPLADALADRDREVRYYAVRGLAELAGQPEWTPSIPEFESNEERYLQHWKQWAAGRVPEY